ncbi:hypothetical protein QOZ80_9AG0687890 [Eleusine coracana subsp. coracana]|nr:hypothetical protein QOZ80_9AG0687890 [Eleusine coracana subsp. coracana]
MDQLNFLLPTFSGSIVILFCLVSSSGFLLFRYLDKRGFAAGLLNDLAAAILILARPSGKGTRRGLSIQVTDHALAHRVLVQHSAAFLDHPANATPSTILSRNLHCNIFSAQYGPFWRAARRNMVTGVLHPSRLSMFAETRGRVLRGLVDALNSGAPAGENLHFPIYQVIAEMCFGKDVIAKIGETGVRAMHKLQRDMLLALPSFTAVAMYPWIGKFLYPSRWGKLLAFRRQQEHYFLPLVAEIKSRKPSQDYYSYVGSLLELCIHELGDVQVPEGQLVSLISEFLGNASDSTGAALEWTMANLVKHPEVQTKLRAEINSVVCGGEGFIEETDLSRMPYLRAIVLESIRRHPTIPFVMRHVKGDEAAKALGVSRLPRGGTTVNFLVGKISRNPDVWSNAMSFSPERFMPGGEGECVDLTGTREIKMMPFGAGRRVCPGMTLAMFHLGYFVANLVREFDWLEADGDEAVDLTEYHGFPFTTMKRGLQARLVPLVRLKK